MSMIQKFMEGDHRRLDEIFGTVGPLAANDLSKAVHSFAEFRQGLQRHIVWEEEILFPIFDERSGMEGQGPTAVMRQEHRILKTYLERVHEGLSQLRPIKDLCKELIEVLLVHNKKEEKLLYPWIDRMVGHEEARQLIALMQAMPEERFQHCCGSEPHEGASGRSVAGAQHG